MHISHLTKIRIAMFFSGGCGNGSWNEENGREKIFLSYIEADVHITGQILLFHLNFLRNFSVKHTITHAQGIRLTTRDWQTL